MSSYLNLLSQENARICKERWIAECKTRTRIRSFKAEESDEITSLKTSLQYLEMYCKLGVEFEKGCVGDITGM